MGEHFAVTDSSFQKGEYWPDKCPVCDHSHKLVALQDEFDIGWRCGDEIFHCMRLLSIHTLSQELIERHNLDQGLPPKE